MLTEEVLSIGIALPWRIFPVGHPQEVVAVAPFPKEALLQEAPYPEDQPPR